MPGHTRLLQVLRRQGRVSDDNEEESHKKELKASSNVTARVRKMARQVRAFAKQV